MLVKYVVAKLAPSSNFSVFSPDTWSHSPVSTTRPPHAHPSQPTSTHQSQAELMAAQRQGQEDVDAQSSALAKKNRMFRMNKSPTKTLSEQMGISKASLAAFRLQSGHATIDEFLDELKQQESQQ